MMSYDAQLSLLSAHADSLNEGEGAAARFLQRHRSLAPEMLALMSLAWRLKQVLTPIQAPEEFRTRLYGELIAHSQLSHRNDWRNMRRPLYYSLAAVGSVLPLLGIVVWRRRKRSSSAEVPQKDARAPENSGSQQELLASSACDKMHTR